MDHRGRPTPTATPPPSWAFRQRTRATPAAHRPWAATSWSFSEELLGSAIDVAGSRCRCTQMTPSETPLTVRRSIPLGDINGDGCDDYIAAVKDNLTGKRASAMPRSWSSVRRPAPDFALEAATGDLSCKLDGAGTLRRPPPTQAPSPSSPKTRAIMNGDGKDDIALSVSPPPPDGHDVTGLEQAVYRHLRPGRYLETDERNSMCTVRRT